MLGQRAARTSHRTTPAKKEIQNHMRPRQPILSKPRDGEVLLLYLKEHKHTWSAVLGQRVKILLHTPEVQRSLTRQTEELANIREPPCFRRVYPKTFGFQENQFHKLWVSRGRSPQTSMFQKIIPQNLRVPSEPNPQTLGFSILESGCRFFRRSFSSRYPIMGHISKK